MDVVIWNSGQHIDNFPGIYRYIGPYKIAHYVRKAGYQVQVIDHISRLTEERLYNITKKFLTNETCILAISTTFLSQQQWLWPDGNKTYTPYPVYKCILRLKEEFPKLIVIGGGYRSDYIGPSLPVDAVVQHYGEDIFVELLNHHKLGTDEPTFEVRPAGVNKTILRKVYTTPIEKKFDIANDDFHFVDDDCVLPNETLPLEISRGCIFACKFCDHLLLGRKKLDYLRSFDHVKNELIQNYNKWGTTNYFIICDTFNDTTFKMQQWYDMVSSLPFKINYNAYLRADLIHRYPDVAHQLFETGLIGAYHGLESLGEEASKVVGKAWSGKHAKEYIPNLYHNVWKGEVYQSLSFIVGLPGDTRESILDTVNWFNTNDLYGATFLTLGIHRQGYNNRSEFSKFPELYGYSFDPPTSIDNWKLPYWDRIDANIFNKDVVRKTTKGAWFNSWAIMALLSAGTEKEFFKKDIHTKLLYNPTISMLHDKDNIFLESYFTKLEAL